MKISSGRLGFADLYVSKGFVCGFLLAEGLLVSKSPKCMAILAHLGFRLDSPHNTLCPALFPSVYLSIELSGPISSSLFRNFC